MPKAITEPKRCSLHGQRPMSQPSRSLRWLGPISRGGFLGRRGGSMSAAGGRAED